MVDQLFLTFVSISFCAVTSSDDILVHDSDTTVADALAEEIKVLCCVVLNLEDKNMVGAIANTWGKRCNKLVFLRAKDYPVERDFDIPSLRADQHHCHFLSTMYHNDYDWFVLTTKESHIIVENLRFMLANYSPNDTIFFMPNVKEHTGLASLKYILSRQSMKRFANSDLHSYHYCNMTGYDHIMVEGCLTALGLQLVDSQDSMLRDRLLHLDPYNNPADCVVHGQMITSYDQVVDCLSHFPISFNHIYDDTLMYVIDYLVYQLRPYGVNFEIPPISKGKTPKSTDLLRMGEIDVYDLEDDELNNLIIE